MFTVGATIFLGRRAHLGHITTICAVLIGRRTYALYAVHWPILAMWHELLPPQTTGPLPLIGAVTLVGFATEAGYR
jgi:peptidoglycan/LPS O-acetylase OafA/YrhL